MIAHGYAKVNRRVDQSHQSNTDTNAAVCADTYLAYPGKCQAHDDHPEQDVECVKNGISFQASESLESIYVLCGIFIYQEAKRLDALFRYF
jgi:hypothetical protein